ncbi:hypothetical protein Tco_0025866 [Tanacetum coccineum]
MGITTVSDEWFGENIPLRLALCAMSSDFGIPCLAYVVVVDVVEIVEVAQESERNRIGLGWAIFKLHANIVRFQRPPLNKNNSQSSHNKGDQSAPKDLYNESRENVNFKSYAHVVNAGPRQFIRRRFTGATNEGFVNVKLKYMGGFWVMIVFTSEGAKETFRSKVGIGSWFAQLLQASNPFFGDKRVTWIDIEGIPLKVWSKNTFSRITFKWGELLDFDEQEDGYLHSKRVYIKTTLVENFYESFKVIIQGESYISRAKAWWTQVLIRGNQVGSSPLFNLLIFSMRMTPRFSWVHWSEANKGYYSSCVWNCFYHARLRINMLKSKLMGISVSSDKVDQAAKKIGCAILQVPFSYLGSKVGCLMSRIQSWSEIVNNILTRLSKWKLKTLSIGEGYSSENLS